MYNINILICFIMLINTMYYIVYYYIYWNNNSYSYHWIKINSTRGRPRLHLIHDLLFHTQLP